MKKFLAVFLALSCVISITGCSEQDKKFMETLRPVQSNTSTSISNMDFKLNYDELKSIIDDIENYKVPADGEEYEPISNDNSSIDALIDKSGNIAVSIVQEAKNDPVKNYTDSSISLAVGDVSINLGSIYTRGADIYYSREYMLNSVTLGGLLMGTKDPEALKSIDEAKSAMNKAFNGKKYVKMSIKEAQKGSALSSDDIVASYVLSTRKEKQLDDFMTILKDFNSLCVTENENGATLELTSDNYSATITRMCEYLRGRKNSYAELFGLKIADYDESDALFDSIIGAVNNYPFNNFMETAGMKFVVKDSVAKVDDTHYTDTIEGTFGKENKEPIGTLTSKTEYTLSDNVVFENVNDFVDNESFINALMNLGK